jgi:hypothetical protein
MRSWLQLAAIALACAGAIVLFFAWRADRRERNQLQAELSATEKTLADLTARQSTRDADLARTLTHLAEQKQAVRTPSQALRALPSVLPLPTAIQDAALALPPLLQNPAEETTQVQAPQAAQNPPPQTVPLPTNDLKPLYDFALDCQACQARLSTVQADLADEKAKNQALSRERDDALRAARGGSLWRRVGRAAKWFAIGAAAGAIAAKTAP